MVAKRPPPRLGRLLRRGGAPPGFGRASVFTPAGGLTARPTAVNAQVRLGSGAAEPQPPYGVIRPHLPWIRGAPVARTRVAGGRARGAKTEKKTGATHYPRCFSTPPPYSQELSRTCSSDAAATACAVRNLALAPPLHATEYSTRGFDA